MKTFFEHYAKLAEGTRAAATALGLTLFADESCISNVLTAINIPENIDGGKLVKTMRDDHGVTCAGGQGHLKGKIIRIAHMGCVNEDHILEGLEIFEQVLAEMGHGFDKGVGVNAAKEVFNNSEVKL